MSIQENCRVVENTRLGEGLYLMVLDAPEIVKLTQCGQFVHIACGEGHLLRRPISICTWQGSHLRIVFQVKGDGTKWLSERKVGDVLDVLGPLGHGFDVQALGDRPDFYRRRHWRTADAWMCSHGSRKGCTACRNPRFPQQGCGDP